MGHDKDDLKVQFLLSWEGLLFCAGLSISLASYLLPPVLTFGHLGDSVPQPCQPISALSPGVRGLWITRSSHFWVLFLLCMALVNQVFPDRCCPDSWV